MLLFTVLLSLVTNTLSATDAAWLKFGEVGYPQQASVCQALYPVADYRYASIKSPNGPCKTAYINPYSSGSSLTMAVLITKLDGIDGYYNKFIISAINADRPDSPPITAFDSNSISKDDLPMFLSLLPNKYISHSMLAVTTEQTEESEIAVDYVITLAGEGNSPTDTENPEVQCDSSNVMMEYCPTLDLCLPESLLYYYQWNETHSLSDYCAKESPNITKRLFKGAVNLFICSSQLLLALAVIYIGIIMARRMLQNNNQKQTIQRKLSNQSNGDHEEMEAATIHTISIEKTLKATNSRHPSLIEEENLSPLISYNRNESDVVNSVVDDITALLDDDNSTSEQLINELEIDCENEVIEDTNSTNSGRPFGDKKSDEESTYNENEFIE